MNDADFNPNNRGNVEQKKRNEKVVVGTVKTKPQGAMHKFTDVFISEDVNNVKKYIVSDLILPAAKKLIVDIITDGLNMIFYGSAGRKSSNTNASYVSYSGFSSNDRRDDRRDNETVRTRSGYSYNNLTFEYRADAEDVLMRMREAIREYGLVSVLDLYDFAGLPSNHTDEKYGWVNLNSAYVTRKYDGYVIVLPKALPLN